MRISFFVVLCLLSPLSLACDWLLSLEGERTQGALLRGQVASGVAVKLGDRAVRTTPEGFFAVGFGRDDALEQVLVLERQGEVQQVPVTLSKREYDIQRVEGVPKRTVEPPPEAVLKRIRREVAEIKTARDIDSALLAFLSDFQWPLTGRISGVYGSQRVYNGKPGRPHYGVDVARPAGTVVVAPADAVVTLVQSDNYYSGGTLIMDHGYGVSSTMIHLSEVLVEKGQTVKQGEPVAKVGASGRATGPHLDWRLNWFEVKLDPVTVVGEMEQ
ncbi:MAG: M23 family metallopeptidase [Alcanivorax sp.]|uniref:M23 family metallopeptidase n=1 Tax=Alcanivorax sp. TaxID=1872427 RepID=UPI002612EB80|nr:M23 family metallopeptidase [Alcanivorax sp.]MDF1725979.1 M23 family metallopeptidase [Alcanivorax sp.]